MIALSLACVALLLGLAATGAFVAQTPYGRSVIYGGSLAISSISLLVALVSLAEAPSSVILPLGLPVDRRAFPPRSACRLLPGGRRTGRRRRQPLRTGLWPTRARAAARAAVLSRVSRRHEPGRHRGRRVQLPVRVGTDVACLVGAGHGAPSRARTTRAPATSISSWRASGRSRCCSPSACSPARRQLCLRRDARGASRRPASRRRPGAGADRRRLEGRAWCRCTSGCRSRIPPRPATSRR